MLARILTLVQGQQPGLECVYCLAVESCKSGSSKREQAEGVVDFVLVFKKRTVTEESEPSIASLIRSNGRGGANDRESGVVLAAEFLINHLTKEGDRVCDTVCGTPTPTLRRIASRLKREFIGTDREMNRLTASVDSLSAST